MYGTLIFFRRQKAQVRVKRLTITNWVNTLATSQPTLVKWDYSLLCPHSVTTAKSEIFKNALYQFYFKVQVRKSVSSFLSKKNIDKVNNNCQSHLYILSKKIRSHVRENGKNIMFPLTSIQNRRFVHQLPHHFIHQQTSLICPIPNDVT